MKPKVSVLLPHYNDGKYLKEAVASILSQTFSDFEIVMVDDASTDEASLEVLHECEQLDERIRVIYNEENRGPAYTTHVASAAARGEFLHGIGADDVHYPNLLKRAVEQFDKHPELGMCWAPLDWGKEDDLQCETFGFEPLDEPLILDPKESQKRLLTQELKVSSVTGVYRRSLSEKYGHYIDELSYYSDWFLLNLILLNHPCAFIPEPMAYFRVRENNYSNTARSSRRKREKIYDHMFAWLNQKEHHKYREQFKKTALLVPAFHDGFWRMLFDPRYMTYWPYIAKKYPVRERIIRSLTKRFTKRQA